MSRVFVIADLHLGHVKLTEVRGFATVEAHDQAIVEAWNRTVTKRDVVYVLGDMFHLDLVPTLIGTKKIALGNHDCKPFSSYLELFSKAQAYFEYDRCLLSHIPVNPNQFHRYRMNVHGHMHAGKIDDPRYACVSVEQCPGMAPMLLRDLVGQSRPADPA